jgi:hemerythrin-like metal-binding protein
MSIITWKNEYSVGVFEIDNQHKKLVMLINTLFDAMKQGQANRVLGSIISELLFYAQTHFRTEEKYFDQFNYKETEEHKVVHQSFISEMEKFKAGFDSGKITLSLDVFNFLKSWLDEHILGEDKKYEDCFKENGLS